MLAYCVDLFAEGYRSEFFHEGKISNFSFNTQRAAY
jgi:hypothetical protein